MKTHASSKTPAMFVVLAIAVLLSQTIPAAAQAGPPPDAPRWGKERIETVIIGKFASELELTPEQAEQFFPRFRQFQNRVEELQRQQAERQRALDDMSRNPDANREQVNQLLTQQSQDEEQASAAKRQFLTDVSGFLSPQQVSRCSVLLNELRAHVQRFMEEHRHEHGKDNQSGHSRQDTPRRRGF